MRCTIRRRHRRLAADRRASVGVEFTLVLPLMLTLLFGTYELTQMGFAHTRLVQATEAVAAMITAQNTVNPTLLADKCNGAGMMMLPFGKQSLAMDVVSVTQASGASASMDWEYVKACPTTASAMGAAKAVSWSVNKLFGNGDSIIVIISTYTYTPLVTFVFNGSLTLTHRTYARPRQNTTVSCTGC